MADREEDPTEISDGAPPSGTASRGPITALLVGGVVLMTVVVGIGAYLFGHSEADAGGAYDTGLATGQGEIRAEYAEGTPRYKAIYDDGVSVGETRGRAEGLAQGRTQGKQQGEVAGQQAGLDEGRKLGTVSGTQAGAAEALGNFGDWQTGALYVVKVAANDQPEVPTVISQRRQMDPDLLYELCQDNPDNLCTRASSATVGQ